VDIDHDMSQEKVISADQIKKHQAHGNLWIAIHGNVYDVSEFMEDHPYVTQTVLSPFPVYLKY